MSVEPKDLASVPGSQEQLDHLSPVKRALLERLIRKESGPKALTIPKRSSGSPPALAMQQNMWLLHQMDPESAAYHIVRAWRLRGPLDIQALDRALHAVEQRHESLRTSLAEVNGELCMQVHEAGTIELTRIDLSGASDLEAALAARVEELSRQPFDLAQSPLWRTWLLHLGEQDHVLLIVFHHILSDLWSLRVFSRDVSVLYSEYSGGAASRLPELPIQYADFAAWEAEQPGSRMPQHPAAHYWKERLSGRSLQLELPTDRLRPAVATGRGRQVRFELSPQASAAVRGLGREEQATPYMTLLSSWAALMHRFSGQTDIMIGSPTAGRNVEETRDLVGLLVDSLVVPVDLSGDPTFRELLKRVRTETLGTFDHPIPFQRLVEAIRPQRHAGQNPIFQVLVAMQNVPPMPEEWHAVQAERLPVENQTAKFDLSLYVFEEPHGLSGYLEYSTDLFDEATARRWVEHWKVLLASVCENPDQQISHLPVLTEAERQQILVDWNRTEIRFSQDRCLPELFDEQAARTPDAPAVVFEGRTVSYRELRERSDRLAAELQRRGVRRESLVGLYVERSPFLLVALMGIMKAGGVYVPMDPAFPPERLKFLLEDGPIRFVITEEAVRGTLPEHLAEEIRTEQEAAWPVPSVVGADKPAPEDLVYILYTSGSTGKPKGVAVTHRSLVNLLENIRRDPGFEAHDRLLALTTVIFDIAALELYLPLIVGASVVLASRETALDPALLAQTLTKSRITVMQATPVTWRMLMDSGWVAPQPIRAWTGGEALAPDLAARMLQNVGPVWNLYGPTETTIYSTGGRIENSETRPPIGRPIANTQTYILDRFLQPVPVGIPGDLYIGGVGLARGYWRRPELTEERFITVPLPTGPSRLYKTGDLARYWPDGKIEYLGRQDFQVKLRGFRIELGDIESHLRQYPDVADAAVALREDIPGNPRLVAYLASTAQPAPASAEIRAFLAELLPDYMIPSSVVILDALPLTPNGKVDRKALPAPPAEHGSLATSGPPLSPLEADLIALWESVLHVPQIGPLDNFFDLGGSSILAAQVSSAINKFTGKQLPLTLLFRSPTVRQLAEVISQQQGAQPTRSSDERKPVSSTIPKRPSGPPPASPMQRSLWLLQQMQPESSAYHVVRSWRLRGPLDVVALGRAVDAVQQRHESLRTSLGLVNGELCQQVHECGIELPLIDWSRAQLSEAALAGKLEELTRQPFDLGQAPLWRARLVRVGEQDHVLLTVFHHIVVDLWSLGVFSRDLSVLYNEFSRAKGLPDLPIQYGDYAAWEAEQAASRMPQHPAAGYWKERLAGNSLRLELPTDRPRPAVGSGNGRNLRFDLAPKISAAVRSLGRNEEATPYMTLLASWAALLHRYCGQNEMVFGSPTAGRNVQESRDLVGLFVDTLVVPLDLSGDPTFREFLGRVRTETLGTFDHPIPFQRLVEAIHPERHDGLNPIFQVFFAMQNVPPMQEVWQGLRPERQVVENRTAKFDLSLYVFEEALGLRGVLEYSTDLFDEATVRRWLEHWKVLLAAVCENPDQRISQLPILTDAERKQILVDWNRTEMPFSQDRCLPELFDEQAARTPDAPAVVFEDRSVTYRELRERSDRMAAELRRRGVNGETLVGVCLERTPFLLVALLGVMKARGAYVPLDPAFPVERLRFLLEDGPIRFLITEDAVRGSLPEHSAQEIRMEEESGWPASGATVADEPAPADLAYVLYTSGSTGKPKGVAVSHRALVNFLESMRRDPGLEKEDRLLAVTTVTFDIAGLEMYLPLITGACVVLASRETALDPVPLAAALANSGITVMQATPVTWRMLLDAGWVPTRPLKVLCGGEALPADLAARLHQTVGRFWNLYGPTETTIWSTVGRIESSEIRPSIGRPIANTQIYILDRSLQPVPVGIPGDLYIGGEGLARGYWHRPELTEERFLTVQLPAGSSRLYKTGDLARYWPDGKIEYLGRQDFQVKLRGFRIELEGIETHLRQHPSVSDAAVALREDTPDNPRLVAYLTVAQPAQAPTLAEIRAFLAERLPDYMIPSSAVILDALPLTPNGKVDRKALPAPSQEREATATGGPPRSALELELISIWETLLQVRPIGPQDNFFDLGGTSLMAAQVFARIAKLTGTQLPLALLFRTPTVRQLAEIIGEQGTNITAPCLVPIQTAGRLPAFFCVHGALGKVLIFRKLALALGFDQPFYAFEAPDVAEEQVGSASVEDMAQNYLRELRAFQPKGPYYLGGLSLGALVASEMARVLSVQGEKVSVILFDPRLPSSASLWRDPRLLATRMAHVMRRLRSEARTEKWAYLKTIAQNLKGHEQSRRASQEPEVFREEDTEQPLPKNIVLLRKSNVLAANRYVPRPFAAKVRLFLAKDSSGLGTAVSTATWKELALDGIDIRWLPGGHADYFQDQWLSEFASTLKDALRECREEHGYRNPE